MGVTHLQSYSSCLEEEERAQESVGGEEGTHFGVRKMEFHSKYSFSVCLAPYHKTLMFYGNACLHAVCPTFKRHQTKHCLMFCVEK